MKYIIILALLLSSTAHATGCDLPTQIAQGDKSPCTGYVMSPDTEQKIRTDLTYKDLMIDNLNKQNAIQSDMLKINSEQLKNLSAQGQLTDTQKLLYFGLGALLTGLASYAAVRAIR